MIIGIDGNEANVDKKVGISEFAFQLLICFAKYQISNVKFHIYLKNSPRDELPRESGNWKYKIVKPKKLWTQIGLPISLYTEKPRPDVFFSPTHYAPRLSPSPTVISIMDLAYIHYPQMFKKSDLYQLKHWTEYSVRNAKRVVTISTSTKSDIIKQYDIASDKVIVVYPGIKNVASIKHQALSMNELKEKYNVSGKFILFVGTLQPRKNIERLVEAFKIVASSKENAVEGKKDLTLVIIGKKGWLYEDMLAAPKKFEVEDRVKFLEFVPDEDLPSFYKVAECFVLPSLYEGFGLPVLEAMKYGCPVIASNISSLPEVGGAAALYVDPYNIGDITKKIESVLDNPSQRKKMIEEGYKQVKKFSWEKSAEKVLDVLKEVALNK